MKRRTRAFVSYLLTLVLLITLVTGCSSSTAGSESSAAVDPSSSAASEGEGSAKEPIVIKFAHHMSLDQSIETLAHEFADEVAEKSNGELEVQVFGASQIGGLKDNTDALRFGTLEMALTDLGTIATIYPLAGVGGLPFLFRDYEHVEHVYDGPVGQKLADEIVTAANIRILGYTHSGFRSIITKGKGLDSPAAAVGMKIRVPEIPMYLETIKAFGANPTVIPLNEAYTSLQTGVVDGLECPNDILYTYKLYEVTDYICRSRHIYSDSAIGVSETFWQSLSPEHQAILEECTQELVKKHRQSIIDMDDQYYEQLLESGLQEVQPDTEAFSAAVQPVWDAFIEQYDAQELVDEIVNTK